MELWLDTVDFNVIEQIRRRLHVTGVTTNPSILAQSKLSFKDTISKLLEIQNGLVAVQIIANDHFNMIKEAEKIYSINNRIIIKIPVTDEGLLAISYLSKNNLPTLATAVFEPKQIILSALSGAKYVAPYLGRIENGFTVLKDMQEMVKINNYPLKIMAAAIKSVDAITDCAMLGINAITVPDKILKDFIGNLIPTIDSLKKFEADWAANPNMNFNNL